MALNGTDLISNPWDSFFSVYGDIIGVSWYLIPISFIAVALYIKTRTFAVSGMWLMASTLMIGSALFVEHPEMSFVYYLFTVLSFVGIVVSIYLEAR